MTEYKMVRDAVADARKAQGQLDNFALAGLGLSVPLVLTILELNPDVIGALLLVTILFFIIAYAQLRYERMLVLNAVYADFNLGPKINSLISQLSFSPISLFEYEKFLAKDSWVPHLFLEWLATMTRAAISLSTGIGLLAAFLYLKFTLDPSVWQAYEFVLLFLNAFLFIGDVVIARRVGRIRHDYLTGRDYFSGINANDDIDEPNE